MRASSLQDCLRVLGHFGVAPAAGQAIDIGGTEFVYLNTGRQRNPLLDIHPHLAFLDRGFNLEALNTRADHEVDFLDPHVAEALDSRFDMVFCFDTLEHVSDPATFCEHLLRIVRPGGHVYLATVFEWPYHPSPEDYFRFSPSGLRECFRKGLSSVGGTILWCDWESDRRAVALLANKGASPESKQVAPLVLELTRQASVKNPPSGFFVRVGRFIHNPWSEKKVSLRNLFVRFKSRISRLLTPRPVRLPWGCWMLVWADVMGDSLRRGGYEQAERLFTARFVQPGMTFLDVGAHNGYYSLLAAHCVGCKGRVVAFEPSPRERRRLHLNLTLNRCRNVTVEPCALGYKASSGSLFVVQGNETGFNSLRLPDLDQPTRQIPVVVDALDRYVARAGLTALNFIKMDVEGGERDALLGASETLERFHPAVMCELADARTAPWGYPSVWIYDFLVERGYR
ncbi:MAG: FkbM family methyltransferase, partial [Lysobacterales bacterium]